MMKIILFEERKIAFQLLLIILSRRTIIDCQLNLYDTDPVIKDNYLQFNCLNYYLRDETLAHQDLMNVIDEVIPYCFRPTNDIDVSSGEFVNTHGQNLSFEELCLANITAQQLLSWSASIDLAERYQFYLNELNSSLNENFYNCTKPWFGPRCQYSLEFGESMLMNEIVEAAFHRRVTYTESSGIVPHLPCYTHLRCDRGAPLCLDWREVCDGHVDCLDGGLDEALCFDMEMNECGEDEYRCHNGLCISKEFWEDGLGNADCLDRSDELSHIPYPNSCFQDPTFRCEEHSCRPNWLEFSCGDGQCVQTFQQCHNGRHILLATSMAAKGDLSEKCWIAMVCLTKLVKEINGSLCETWLMSNFVFKFLKDCDSLFQFPTIPFHFGHIRLFYNNPHLRSNVSTFLLPDYVCYDQQLCDFLTPSVSHEILTCVYTEELQLDLDTVQYSWTNLIIWIKYYFRGCLTAHTVFDDKKKYEDHLSLYHCQNSSKFISKHRIVDEYVDCYLNDDEHYQDSCALNDKYRVQCPNQSICLSPLLNIDDCLPLDRQHEKKIPFQNLCDGIPMPFVIESDGQDYTDEFNCSDWPCDNIYSRCDGFWTCKDGRDEENCNQTRCSPRTHSCISPFNYTLLCLPPEQVADNRIDCLGASDEPQHCRIYYSLIKDPERFRCLNSDICLPLSELCNNDPSCPSGDDESFCENHRLICHEDLIHNRTAVEDILCRLSEKIRYFSLHTSSNYPPSDTNTIDGISQWSIERRLISIDIKSRVENNSWPWSCNRGLVVRIALENDSEDHTCMCPPSYYGHLCQYQNQRVSLTLGLVEAHRRASYAIVTMLIDEQQQIESYDQYVFITRQSCSVKLHRYLLYSRRPKNISKNYSVRIDAFSKNTVTYLASWHFNIPFLFLPVNRLAVQLYLPSQQVPVSSNCLRICNNGECVKYVNEEKYFCRCLPGWSGIQCNTKINCESCSSDSICIGSVNNRSICVCPLVKSGPRCLLTSSCPANACKNDGQCVPADASVPGSDYTCICSDQFFGSQCQYSKVKVEVSLNDMNIPSYLLAYLFTINRESEPTSTIILQKLTLFQRIVTFRISVPFHLMIIKASSKFYLAVVQKTPRMDISTSISPNRQCIPIEALLNSTLMKIVWLQRVKLYHTLCQTRLDLNCFIDEVYLCLCTNERHANCIRFDRDRNLQCSSRDSCVNEAHCLQNHPTCPSSIICVCTDCFFGNQCQFYAKGLGLTLDEILGYEIKHNAILSEQAYSVRISASITMVMFVLGIINAILAILTFKNKKPQQVGCGMYLLASSITSFLTVTLFTLKFWFLVLSRIDLSDQRWVLYANCMCVEPLLKALLYVDNWLNACVAIERAFAVFKGINFNKKKSKRVAKRVIICLIVVVILLFIPQLSFLRLFDDKKENRTWCVILYSPLLYIYSTALIIFHFFTPLFINLFSTVFIILTTAHQRATAQSDHSFKQHLISRLKQYKHLLISPLVLVALSLPHLIISFILDCNKSSRHFWFYLIGYFISFIPSVLVFVVFVLPSSIYRKEFKDTISRLRRRFSLFKMNFCAR